MTGKWNDAKVKPSKDVKLPKEQAPVGGKWNGKGSK